MICWFVPKCAVFFQNFALRFHENLFFFHKGFVHVFQQILCLIPKQKVSFNPVYTLLQYVAVAVHLVLVSKHNFILHLL
jgi:hypothetical protein